MKSLHVKFVNDSSSFDIAEYDSDNQIVIFINSFKEKCWNLKTTYVIKVICLF